MKEVIEARGLRLEVNHEVYTPREDSFLMIDLLKEQNFKSQWFCEIGPGTGIIGLSVADRKSQILMIDINKQMKMQEKISSQMY